MSTRKRKLTPNIKTQDEGEKETPRTMLSKLRSYPDTIESKQRKIGMYKSPAPSGRKPKAPSSKRKSSILKKAPLREPKGSSEATPPIIKNIKELKAATMELNEITPQYPPAHPVITPKNEKPSTIRSVTRSATRSVTPKNKQRSEASPQITTQIDSPGVKHFELAGSGTSTVQISLSNRTKSSLRSCSKSHDMSSRRVSFGPVHEYHPDNYAVQEEMNEFENEENDDEELTEDDSLMHEGSPYLGVDKIAIPAFDQAKSKSPLLQTPQLLLSRSSNKVKSNKTKDHARTTKRINPTIPASFTKKQFCIFAKKKITREAADILVKSADDFIEYISKELEVYALHAKRKTINMSDVILFMTREKYLTGNETFSSLANKYMCDEHISEIVPCVKVLSMKPPST